MKRNFKVKREEINRLIAKEKFTVSDLIKVLNNLHGSAQVTFGVLSKKGLSFSQDENFIFKLSYDSRIDEWDDNYVVEILTSTRFD